MNTNQPDTFRILSLCGGGLSGAFSAAFLRDIERNTGKRLVDHFDLITGTSTGGIIALGLGLGISASHLYDFYRDKGGRIFPQSVAKGLRWLHRSKYSSDALKQELQSVFGDRLLSESEIPLVVPSYNLGMNQVRLFKTRHNDRFEIDHKIPAWKVARATSAAPTYLPVCREIFGLQLIDGGVWANNPVLVGLTEALSQFNAPARSIRVLSVGTTVPIKRCRKKLDNAGIIGWGTSIAETFMMAQSSGAIGQVSLIIGKQNIIHIDPTVADGEFKLDRSEPEKAAEIANHHATHCLPEIKSTFLADPATIGRNKLSAVKKGITHDT